MIVLNRERVQRYLRTADLAPLFTEELGWEHCDSELVVPVGEVSYTLSAVAEKRGLIAYLCQMPAGEEIPPRPLRVRIERQAAKYAHQHLIVFLSSGGASQVWQWARRDPGEPVRHREQRYERGQTGEALIERLQILAFSLEEEETLGHIDVTRRVRAAFDVERVTRRFYDLFRKERDAFARFLQGIPDEGLQRWYVSVMLNRLMFIYFIQKKGLLDSDGDYLRRKLEASRGRGRDRYYRDFLCPLFFTGLAHREEERPPETNRLLGRVPYLNGGLFQRHPVEEQHGQAIEIADAAFERLYAFFDAYQWHLDDRPLRDDNEINPDVLGYIFEKYINQKQMGAYYTKEDITGYISQNTIIPYLLDQVRADCRIAFAGVPSVWSLLQENPERYIYEAVRKGVELALPAEIAAGLDDISRRSAWNTPAPAEYALPTETWREVVARRRRYEELWLRMAGGEIHEVSDLVTYNLDIRQFAQDLIEQCEGPELLRAFWQALEKVTVLDPTCGSGAFLFAALNILEPLYQACLERMEEFVREAEAAGSPKYPDLRAVLERVGQHPNRAYFVCKTIIVNNLYGVDIMDEAVEICKLRLFLKLVAQIERAEEVEPLPDIDFNIRAGNTLVGYTTREEVRKALTEGKGGQAKMLGMLPDVAEALERIEEQAEIVDRAYRHFREMQTDKGMDPGMFREARETLRWRLEKLEEELHHYLAKEHGVSAEERSKYEGWLSSHRPFHWLVHFFRILAQGGFNVIIGNPPYVVYSASNPPYRLDGYSTLRCNNLYALIFERSLHLLGRDGRLGLIVPVSFSSAGAFEPLRRVVRELKPTVWVSHFANRPGQLFTGAQNRLTIVLLTTRSDDMSTFSTRYHRWDSNGGERQSLFRLLEYVGPVDPKLEMNGLFPKIGSQYAASALGKVLRNPNRTLERHVIRAGTLCIYWVRVPGYFCQFLLEAPKARPEKGGAERIRGEVNSIALADAATRRAVHSILNSSTFDLYFLAYTDGRHINPSDVRGFPVDLVGLTPDLLERLVALSVRLHSCLVAHRSQWRKSGLLVDSYDSKPCKPIIDQIDRVLASHYGLTDEEIDFVVNHDVKYRMGSSDLQGKDEEEVSL